MQPRVVFAERGRPDPQVPVEGLGRRGGIRPLLHALRPHRAIGEDVHLAHIPDAPDWIHSTCRRSAVLAWCSLSIWVATPNLRAAIASCRASQMEWAIGFSVDTALPCCMARMEAGKGVWSGVETTNASVPF